MTSQFQSTGIIRQRGQLTIPDSIRSDSDWLAPNSVVSIKKMTDKQIVVEPYSETKKEVDWDKIWKMIERVRSFKGRGSVGSLSEFIVKDRKSHF